MKNLFKQFKTYFCSIFIIWVFGVSSLVSAQITEVTITTQSFDDWIVRCEQNNNAGKKCVMTQQASVEESGRRLMQANIAKVDETPRMTLLLPLGIFLPAGAYLQSDEDKAALEISFCNQSGCYANIELDRKMMDLMGSNKMLEIVISLTNGQEVQVPLSTKGFKNAFKSLN